MFKESDNPFVTCMKCDRCDGLGFVDFRRCDDEDHICKKCNGSGYFAVTLNEAVAKLCKVCHGSGNYTYSLTCFVCDGYGFLDWLETILGKKIDIEFDYTIGIGEYSSMSSLPRIVGMTVYDLISYSQIKRKKNRG